KFGVVFSQRCLFFPRPLLGSTWLFEPFLAEILVGSREILPKEASNFDSIIDASAGSGPVLLVVATDFLPGSCLSYDSLPTETVKFVSRTFTTGTSSVPKYIALFTGQTPVLTKSFTAAFTVAACSYAFPNNLATKS
ncbi:hypothetical protein FQA39_LY00788, partial [Lamprigera yunnana]